MMFRASEPRTAARLEIAGAVFLLMALLLVGAVVLLALGVDEGDTSVAATESAMLAQAVGSVAALGLAMFWRSRAPWCGTGSVVRAVGVYLLVLPLWVGLAVGVTAIWNALGWPTAPQPHLAYLAAPSSEAMRILFLAVICVLGPATEEVIFRGHLQTGLVTLLGARAGVALSAALFGLLHVGSGTVLFLPITALGLLFGWIRQRSDGLLAPFVVHGLHNSVTVAAVIGLDLLPSPQ